MSREPKAQTRARQARYRQRKKQIAMTVDPAVADQFRALARDLDCTQPQTLARLLSTATTPDAAPEDTAPQPVPETTQDTATDSAPPLCIPIHPDDLADLADLAHEKGQTPAQYVADLIEATLSTHFDD